MNTFSSNFLMQGLNEESVYKIIRELEAQFFDSTSNALASTDKPHLFSFSQLTNCDSLIQGALRDIESAVDPNPVSTEMINKILVEPAINAFKCAWQTSCPRQGNIPLNLDALRLDLLTLCLASSMNMRNNQEPDITSPEKIDYVRVARFALFHKLIDTKHNGSQR